MQVGYKIVAQLSFSETLYRFYLYSCNNLCSFQLVLVILKCTHIALGGVQIVKENS